LTLQTDFAARWCFWFSANDSSIEHSCPPLVYFTLQLQKLVLHGVRKLCFQNRSSSCWCSRSDNAPILSVWWHHQHRFPVRNDRNA